MRELRQSHLSETGEIMFNKAIYQPYPFLSLSLYTSEFQDAYHV